MQVLVLFEIKAGRKDGWNDERRSKHKDQSEWVESDGERERERGERTQLGWKGSKRFNLEFALASLTRSLLLLNFYKSNLYTVYFIEKVSFCLHGGLNGTSDLLWGDGIMIPIDFCLLAPNWGRVGSSDHAFVLLTTFFIEKVGIRETLLIHPVRVSSPLFPHFPTSSSSDSNIKHAIVCDQKAYEIIGSRFIPPSSSSSTCSSSLTHSTGIKSNSHGSFQARKHSSHRL